MSSSSSTGATVQSRRSHTKSRLGCKTCKRRHIRCDETTPQCNNCTKHKVICSYRETMMTTDGVPDLKMTPQIQRELDAWRNEGIYPFPTLENTHIPSPHQYSETELRLIHHISHIATQMQATDASSRYAIWTKRVPMFLRIAASHEFVMHALLGLSASHLSWLTSSPGTVQLSYQHRGRALRGLQQAIGNFSKHNADAVLAASILLSWQVTDWQSWQSLMQGTTTVIDSMQAWRHQSCFSDLIAEKEYFNMSLSHFQTTVDPARDRNIASHVHSRLRSLEGYFSGKGQESRALAALKEFIEKVWSEVPVKTQEEQFKLLHPLRSFLFFLPIDFLRRGQSDVSTMVLLAYFFGVALAVEPLFPAVGSVYFGTLAVGPIEQIHQNLQANLARNRSREAHDAVGLMGFPLQMLKEFRERMNWTRIDHHLAATTTTTTSPVMQRSSMSPQSPHHPQSPFSSEPHLPALNYDWQAFGDMSMPSIGTYHTANPYHTPHHHETTSSEPQHPQAEYITSSMWRMDR
ncbi:hypothetical protein EX30DRAFT_308912 [Ascodesmis nigricans]|uniref:Zn(2)-C6 fungal-type domain-containing protein n=1 Tax=Ascodesmis nigricans TaxID=341454 RepID=A0A4S2MQF5_9PEZI|nr:hypothetical protein EX30DRAFT_308912 [Ascodesmis nigricans]